MKKKILFIGNSYTYYHDMPERIFAPMAKEKGYDFEVQALTHGGYKLEWFADPENEEGKRLRSVVEGRHYDCIVLQDHSLSTITDPAGVFGGIRSLKALLEDKTDKFVLIKKDDAGNWSVQDYTIDAEGNVVVKTEKLGVFAIICDNFF